MRILFLTPQLPYPPRQGTALRNWGLIKHLAERHAITLLSFAEADQPADAPELRAACRRVIAVPAARRSRAARLRTLFSPHPDLARRLWSPDFARILTDLLRESQFDIVHLEGLEMAPYLPLLRTATLHAPRSTPTGGALAVRVVYDAHNVEHILQRRAFATDTRRPARWPAALYSWLQIPRLEKFEAEVCRIVDCVTCVSEKDAAALRQLVPTLQPIVVPNGIEVEAYTQSPIITTGGASTGGAIAVAALPAPALLVFTGKMDYRPNLDAALWFVEAILPLVRTAWPEAQFVVVGQKPPERLQRLNGQNGIVVTGAVEDVRPYIARASVYLVPLRMGGGTRFKLLEAMALARPIVSTTVGAEGYNVTSGRELLLADSPADFAAAILDLLSNPAHAAGLGESGRAFVQAGYDWRVIIPRLEAVYDRQGVEET